MLHLLLVTYSYSDLLLVLHLQLLLLLAKPEVIICNYNNLSKRALVIYVAQIIHANITNKL